MIIKVLVTLYQKEILNGWTRMGTLKHGITHFLNVTLVVGGMKSLSKVNTKGTKAFVRIVVKEIKVPITRFRRELRKWLRKNETVAITRCGVIVAYCVPIAEYDEMINFVQKKTLLHRSTGD